MRRGLQDPWIQIMAFLVILSGGLTAHGLIYWRLPKPSLPAILRPRGGPGAAVPGGGGARSRRMKPRTPGHWIVDVSAGAGADTSRLSEALANAGDGEVVFVRPGLYSESLVVAASVSVRGQGAERTDVRIHSSLAQTIELRSGWLGLSHLTVENDGPKGSAALRAASGGVELAEVRLKAGREGTGAAAAGTRLSIARSEIEAGSVGVDLTGGARAEMSAVLVFGAATGLIIEGKGSSANVRGGKFERNRYGIWLKGQSEVRLEEVEVALNSKDGIWASEGSRVVLKKCRLGSNANALVVKDQSRADIVKSDFEGQTGAAILAGGGSQVDDQGSTLSRNASGVEASGKSNLRLDETRIGLSRQDALRLSDGAIVMLHRAVVEDNSAAGVRIASGAELHVIRAEILGNKGCGVELDGGAAFLDGARVQANQCGVAFHGSGRLQSHGSDYTGNHKGPYLYSKAHKINITLKGTANLPPDFQAVFE